MNAAVCILTNVRMKLVFHLFKAIKNVNFNTVSKQLAENPLVDNTYKI